MYYFSRLYSNTVKIGEDYETAKRVVLIAILDYDLDITKYTKEMQTQWMLRETKTPEKILTDKIEVDIIELSKVKEEYKKNKENKKAQWMLFNKGILKGKKDKEIEIAKKMKQKGIDIETIIEITQLTKDEIEKLN